MIMLCILLAIGAGADVSVVRGVGSKLRNLASDRIRQARPPSHQEESVFLQREARVSITRNPSVQGPVRNMLQPGAVPAASLDSSALNLLLRTNLDEIGAADFANGAVATTPAAPAAAATIPVVTFNSVNPRLSGAAQRVSSNDQDCVMCQYFVQRLRDRLGVLTASFNSEQADVARALRLPPLPGQVDPLVSQLPGYTYPRTVMVEQESQISSSQSVADLADARTVAPGGSADGTYLVPRRYRAGDMVKSQPVTIRPRAGSGNDDQLQQQNHEVMEQVYQQLYKDLDGLCAQRVPDEMSAGCQSIAQNFRFVSEGLRYGDRPDEICARNDFCAAGTYVFTAPHKPFKSAPASL